MSLLDSIKPRETLLEGVLTRHLPAFFGIVVFLSALLLFGVQPMFTKMVLPQLGGSPAVWSVAMVFFQALLLLGYLYAHFSVRFLSGIQSVALHGVLVASAFLVLPLSVSMAFGGPPDTGQGPWLIAVFMASVGLPFFALAATAPLLQAWFARSGHARSGNPYFLYVASNLGSFAALLAYPLVIEPLLALQAQTRVWMVLFAALGLGLVSCGILSILGLRRAEAAPATEAGPAEPVESLTWMQRVVWIGLAAVPSGLLVSVTAHLSTDVASAPLLWVLPLALFMLTFVLCFRNGAAALAPMMHRTMARITPLIVMSLFGFLFPLSLQLFIHLSALFVASMVCHGLLYEKRPPASQLTEFYLWMSFGGMLGGLFAGLLAPVLFNTILEYRILLIAVILCIPAAATAPSWRKQATFAAFGLLLGCVFIMAAPTFRVAYADEIPIICLAAGAAFLVVALFNRHGPIASAGAVAAAFLVMSPLIGAQQEAVIRSFYGVNYVKRSVPGDIRLLTHGSTVHGAYRLLDLDGKPMTGRPQPTTYYHDDGGINIALKAARAQAGGRLDTVAVLGLGAGAMACQSAQGEKWVFFEIDTEVVKLAQRPDLFPFVSTCTPDARVVIGDARLTLQKERIKFDVIILDAFSSDAVPAHLLTKEAFSVYQERLNPGGMIIAHVSNRYLDIRSVAEAGAMEVGMTAASAYIPVDRTISKAEIQVATPTTVVAMSGDPEKLAPLVATGIWQLAPEASRSTLWTDDYANIPAAIYRKWRDKPAVPPT